jgi:hypothetical protein
MPWELAHAWPGSELIPLADAGHETGTASMVAMTDRFARRTA